MGIAWFHPDFKNLPMEAEKWLSLRLFMAFGPLPEALVSHVSDEDGGDFLRQLWWLIDEEGLHRPFVDWSMSNLPNLDLGAKKLISRMTNLNPAQRATISEVLEDPYWDAVEDLDIADRG